ncbi:MAG: hypothetical protein GY803_23570 [Chloroflexi bacterium]|nr:hypothetical protein [Chloroflexota bacterium]
MRQRVSLWAALLLAVIIVAFGLRLHNLDSFSFWTDEGLTSLRASYSVSEIMSNTITIQKGSGKDTHPPFYYLLVHFSRQVWGRSDFAIRYLSLLAGTLLAPLLYQFGRRLEGDWLGVLAACLTAVNPLQIWYGQEARMYAVLVLLAAWMSYALWRMLATNNWRRYWLPYLLLAGLTVYTHYTAVFLIAVQTLFGAWMLWRNGQRRLVGGAAVLLFIAASPLIPYTIPRLFSGAEAAYSYISPWVILQDVARGFSFGVTVNFSPLIRLLTAGMAVLSLLGLIALSTWQRRLFLLAYLLATPAGIIAGSLIKPMYMGVRHIMIGSPALLLLIAHGFLRLVAAAKQAPSSRQKAFWGGTAVLAVAVLITGPIIAIDNLYHNEHYVKDNFRDLIYYIEEKAGKNDIIVYNDAVLLATHQHYRRRMDLPVTAVPEYPLPAQTSLDVLPSLASNYERIWFLPDPPDDGRDDGRLVRTWLDERLRIVGSHNALGRSALVRVVAYATSPALTAALPADGRPLDIRWASMPPLRGIQLQSTQPTTLPTIWFDLFWQTDAPVNAGTHLRFTLQGPDGKTYLIHHEPLAARDASQNDGFIRQSYALPIPFGTPPGSYALLAEPLVSPTGPSLGEPQPLTNIALAASGSQSARPYTTPSLHFQNGLTLLGIAFPDNEVRPGHNLPFTIYWQADTPLSANLRYELSVIAPDGRVWKQQSDIPGASWLDPWPANVPIAGQTSLYFNPEAAPGVYRLRWRLLNGDDAVGGRPSWRPWNSDENDLGTIEVVPWSLVTAMPDDIAPIQVDFGPNIQLAGFMTKQTSETLSIILYWRAQTPPSASYFSFIHLVNADGDIVAQQAFVPGEGLRPTEGWREGEILADTYAFDLTAAFPPGIYTIIVGLFDPETGERPSVVYQDQSQEHNQLVLGTIVLP